MRTRNLKGLHCNRIVHVFQEDLINDDLDNDESDKEGEPADVNSEEEEDNDDDGEKKLKSFTGFTVQNKHG